jgi:3D (Asp-Asp-Asp) domain-containing protein
MLTNIITATLTAYCCCTHCCGPNAQGINAAGKKPVQGMSIAASRSIPLGSTVIWDNRTYKVDDRLAKKYDARFDIYFDKHSDAKQFGIKHKQQVTIITKQ